MFIEMALPFISHSGASLKETGGEHTLTRVVAVYFGLDESGGPLSCEQRGRKDKSGWTHRNLTTIISSKTNALRCDLDFDGGTLGGHITGHWVLRALLLMHRCGLQQWAFLLPLRAYSLSFCFRCFLGWLMKSVLWGRKIRDEMKST